MDYFRTDCIKSYFEILRDLGEGRYASNAFFFIEAEKLFLGTSVYRKYLLAYRKDFWLPANNFGHESLEKNVCNTLNKHKISSGDINLLIKFELFRSQE